MNKRLVAYILGWVMIFLAGFMLLPCVVGIIYQEQVGVYFFVTAVVTFILGEVLTMYKPENKHFFAKEGFAAVALSWIIMGVIGAIPLCLSGEIPNYIDALFEVTAGFSTTGASVVANVESLTHATLFWRSIAHWIGGMGVLVFLMAILPLVGGENMHLLRAESPGPIVSKLVPRMKTTAKILYLIYIVMTVVQIVLLLLTGLPLFDSICMSLSTAGTGGFGLASDSVASYTVVQQIIITVFMILFGVNFNFYYLLLLKKGKEALKLEEVRWYLILFGIAALLITIDLTRVSGGFLYNLNLATFQVASIMTTTGFATVDYNLWPGFSKCILMIFSFIGACAGSTAGGMKISRMIIYVKTAMKEMRHLIHPRSVKVVKMDDKAVSDETVRTAHLYLVTYIIIFLASVLVLSLDKYDFVTNFTAVAATLNNVGPGLEVVGPMGSFGGFSVVSKISMILNMLIGRLEIFPMLILFMPSVWRKR